MQRLDHYDQANAAWLEVVVEDKRSGPAEIAAMRNDFDAWLGTLNRREGALPSCSPPAKRQTPPPAGGSTAKVAVGAC